MRVALLGGGTGVLIAFGMALAMNAFAYWNSDKVLLSMYGARQVDATSEPQLYGMVQKLAAAAQLPMPKVFITENPQPNAFATGRNPENAAVAATTGILQMLSARELRGVMAHELAHVQHRDILISTISATMAGRAAPSSSMVNSRRSMMPEDRCSADRIFMCSRTRESTGTGSINRTLSKP